MRWFSSLDYRRGTSSPIVHTTTELDSPGPDNRPAIMIMVSAFDNSGFPEQSLFAISQQARQSRRFYFVRSIIVTCASVQRSRSRPLHRR